jgi:predicted nucleotidyltransferase
MKDPAVLGMLIGGSFASGEADDYSDLDMQLVVNDGQVENLVPKLRAMADEAGPVVAAFFAEQLVRATTSRDHSNRALSGLVMRFNRGIAANTTSADRANPPSIVM